MLGVTVCGIPHGVDAGDARGVDVERASGQIFQSNLLAYFNSAAHRDIFCNSSQCLRTKCQIFNNFVNSREFDH